MGSWTAQVVGDDGTVEEFTVRISEEGFEEWLEQREVLTALGRPDRPPDVDTPEMRHWLRHPGEPNTPYFQETERQQRAYVENGMFSVAGVSWSAGPNDATRLRIVGGMDGSFYVAVLAVIGGAPVEGRLPYREYPPEMDANAVGDDIEEMLMSLNSVGVAMIAEPLVTTYSDWLALEAEIELAAADIARGFANPLAEGRA